jgi:hypothetical protein
MTPAIDGFDYEPLSATQADELRAAATTISSRAATPTQQEKQMSYESFRTRDPSQQTVLIDIGRAEVLLNCFVAPSLETPEALRKFVGSLHGACNGNPAILPLLVDAFAQWHDEDGDERERADLERLWRSFDAGQPISDPVTALKTFCTSQPIPLPNGMLHAIFDDPSFDFTAFLDCHRPKEPLRLVDHEYYREVQQSLRTRRTLCHE